ncbi:MAG: Uma2 family endonuclease [Bacteroidota bacterium]
MKVRIEKYNKAVYPDLSAVCGEIEYENERQTVLKNPMLFIEVLSESTKAYDKSEKFEMYRSIPSFQEYMVIYQTIPRVQTWYKETKELWRIESVQGLDRSVYLHSIGCSISLADIYIGIQDSLKDIPQDLSLVYYTKFNNEVRK